MPKPDGFVKVENSIIDKFADNTEKIGAFVIAKQMEFQDSGGVVSPRNFGLRVGWDRSRAYKFLSGIRVLTSRKPNGNQMETPNPPSDRVCGHCGNELETIRQHWLCPDLILLLKKEEQDKPLPLKKAKPVIEYPDWLDIDLWKQFLDNRKKLRKPATDRAQNLLIKELRKLMDCGEDQRRVLEKAIMNGYSGLFPVSNKSQPPPKPPTDTKPSKKYPEVTR